MQEVLFAEPIMWRKPDKHSNIIITYTVCTLKKLIVQ